MGEKNGLTPLLIAASKGHAEEVELLLVEGSEVDDRDPVRGWTPLHFASVYGHVRIIQLLLLHGTDVNSRSRPGATRVAEVGKLSASAKNAFNSFVGRVFSNSRQKTLFFAYYQNCNKKVVFT